MILLIVLVILITVAGKRVDKFFAPHHMPIENMAYGWIVGSGLYLSIVYGMGVLGISWTRVSLGIAACMLLIVTRLLKVNAIEKNYDHKTVPMWVLTIFALLTSFSIILNLYWPVRDWDALTLYDFRAKVFTEFQHVEGIFNNELNYYLAYPFFTTLSHMTSYTFGLQHPSIYYSIVYISLLIIVYAFLQRRANQFVAIIMAILLGLTRDIFHHSFVAYTNLPYTLYLTVSILLLTDAIANKSMRMSLYSGIACGMATHFRYDDPFWVAPLIIIAIHAAKTKSIQWVTYTAVPIAVYKLSWILYKKYLYYTHSYSAPDAEGSSVFHNLSIQILIDHFREVSVFLYDNLWLKYGFLFALVFFGAILARTHMKKSIGIIYAAVMIYIVILFGGTYAMSFLYSKWSVVGGSVQRMFMVFYPLALVAGGLSIGEFMKDIRRSMS